VFRETAHSPGRESDDAEILRLTGKQLESRGFVVELKSPDELFDAIEERPRWMFVMCERPEVLRLLATWAESGVEQVNSPAAVLATYRDRMIARFRDAGVPFIESRIVATGGRAVRGRPPVWVKRADVHNTQEGDVVFADSAPAAAAALASLAARGIRRAVIQPHVEGDLVKFYGIGPARDSGEPGWFRWFYHKDQRLAGHPFDRDALARRVARAAAALSLEVYGGDAIVTPAGRPVLLDVNAWPSFALYREEAAAAIAAHLAVRFATGPGRGAKRPGGPPVKGRRQ
jgi:hypothetical protein